MRNKISIAMATFNGEAYLGEQINSFLSQTTPPNELVISDDGSSDNTILIAKCGLEESLVKLVFKQNAFPLGYAQNFNQALGLASGDIVFLSDQDDVWLKDKLAIISQEFEQNPDKYLLIHDLAYCDENLKLIGQTKLERLKSIGASHRSYVTGMATAIRRELLDICLPIPTNPLITHDLWLHECAHVLDVKSVIPNVLALYRRHDKNVTVGSTLNTVNRTSFFSFIKIDKLESVRTAVDRKIATLEALSDWLGSSLVFNFYINTVAKSHTDFENKRLKVKLELSHAKKRRVLLDKPFPQRMFYGIMLYLQGGYKQFLGKKSLFKDIFWER